MIENEHICKNLSLTHLNLQYLFLVSFWTFFAQCFSVFINEFGQVNAAWKG